MTVKRGEISLDELKSIRLQWEKDFQTAFDNCNLPDSADVDKAHELLIDIRQKYMYWHDAQFMNDTEHINML